jgi:hypothetical protein
MKELTYIIASRRAAVPFELSVSDRAAGAKFLQLAPEKGASCEYLLSGGGGVNL